ncbi:MAG TPA: serine/threonine-protein kinase [Steroidobacteraceae bacterium]|jgi:serine/threonine protein kinase
MDVHAANSSLETRDLLDPTIDLDEQASLNRASRSSVAHEPPVAPGRILLDRYVLVQVLDAGGACTVFRARDLEAGRDAPPFVAVKAPALIDAKAPTSAAASGTAEHLERQFEQTRRLAHIGIAEVFDLQREGDLSFLTMELIEGQSLAALFQSYSGAVPLALTRRILKQVADALSYAHSVGVIHGHLSPAKVFVLPGDRVKILGFGNAGDAPAASSLAYASPQVLEGAPASIEDDIFSFSCMAYELIAGRHPFGRRSAKEARADEVRPDPLPQLPEEHSAVLLKGLSWESAARPSDIKALAAAILPRREPSSTARKAPASVVTPAVDRPDDKRWLMLIAACVVAMIAAVVMTRMS